MSGESGQSTSKSVANGELFRAAPVDRSAWTDRLIITLLLAQLATALLLVFGAHGATLGERWLQLLLWGSALNLALIALSIARRSCIERTMQLEAARADAEKKVSDRTAQLEASRGRYQMLLEGTSAIFWEMDPAINSFTYISPQAEKVLGWPGECWEEKGFATEITHPDDRGMIARARENSPSDSEVHVEYRVRRSDGRYRNVRSQIRTEKVDGRILLRGVSIDITKQRELEIELRQAQKLESVGRLAAGVAHRINNPVQFVADSVHFVRAGVSDLLRLVDASETLEEQVRTDRATPHSANRLAELRATIDLDYLKEELPQATERAVDGLGRVAAIVRSMREFARPDEKEMGPVDLNRAIESTLTIADNEYRYVAEVETNLRELPQLTCHAGDLNQVILSLVINAAQAIGEVVKQNGSKGRIRIETRRDGEGALMAIHDTGAGIPETIRGRIFEPFFSTKGVGKGSGQGLAHARAVVQEQHGGRLTFRSEVGRGTSFFLWLPLVGKRLAPAAVGT